MKKNIVIVDDDPDIGSLLSRFLSKKNYNTGSFQSGMEVLKYLASTQPDLVLLDYRLPDFSGEEVLEKIVEDYPGVKVIIITGYGDVKTAIKTIKKGAFDFVTKPVRPDDLLSRVEEALKSEEPKQERKSRSSNNKQKKSQKSKARENFTQKSKMFIEGNSEASKKLYENIKLVAPTDMAVMILGETGTGKEYMARQVHQLSERAGEVFEAVDCGALPENLSGSTLFGHVKGAFTGAQNDRPGSFELAHGGTLFLDEIGNLSYENQMRLLRVLEEQVVTRLGDTKPKPVDVRIVSATNDDLIKKVKQGKFREDLYHRINAFKIEILPLRSRPADLKIFAEHFLETANDELSKNITGFHPKAMKILLDYPWYGNLRELKNTIKRTVLLEETDEIRVDTLPREIILSIDQGTTLNAAGNKVETLKEAVERAEKQAIISAFKEAGGNKSEVAKLLDVDRKTLYNKLSRYNIDI